MKKLSFLLFFFLSSFVFSITFSPSNPRVGEVIIFKPSNYDYSLCAAVFWDFGDGTSSYKSGEESWYSGVKHTYNAPGVYTVTLKPAKCATTNPPPEVTTVQVRGLLSVTWEPVSPKAGEIVTFRAVNSIGSVLRWDFGDGTSMEAGPVVQHIYRKHGHFTLRIYEQGATEPSLAVTIYVLPGKGPFISLSISAVELLFENNKKAYIVVPLKSQFLRARARIKYEGTGILQGFWTIDGAPYSSFSKTLTFGQSVELMLDRIPALEPGLHVLSLRITNPQPVEGMDLQMPRIYYFVSAIPQKIEICSPLMGEVYFLGEKVELRWKPVMGVQNYSVVISKQKKELFAKAPKRLGKKTRHEFYPSEAGDFYLVVFAENEKGNVVNSSSIGGFRVIESPTRIELLKLKELETDREIEGRLREGAYYLVKLRMLFPETKGKILVRAYLNDKLIDEVWAKPGTQEFETSFKAEKGEVHIRVYEYFPNRLVPIGFKKFKIETR